MSHNNGWCPVRQICISNSSFSFCHLPFSRVLTVFNWVTDKVDFYYFVHIWNQWKSSNKILNTVRAACREVQDSAVSDKQSLSNAFRYTELALQSMLYSKMMAFKGKINFFKNKTLFLNMSKMPKIPKFMIL